MCASTSPTKTPSLPTMSFDLEPRAIVDQVCQDEEVDFRCLAAEGATDYESCRGELVVVGLYAPR
jgi:hypothetical protein